ncbi:MAG: PilW family protein [Xanthomonadaceae bacterium]|jgi:type IV pilus assembly protein PilW|nr:PilW family protein [Xanthomonadaceae bacterium]
MKRQMTGQWRSRRRIAGGFSIIELMVALAIGSVLMLGLVQVFIASRAAYRLSEGVSRAQEDSRFAMDFMLRDIRMGGHFGCVNDQALLQSNNTLVSHLNAANGPLNFAISIQAYEANGTAPGNTVNLAAPTAGWSPALPGYLTSLSPAPNAGSDIIVMKYLNPQGIPVQAIAADQITIDPARWNILTQDGIANPGLFGVSDCVFADIFQAAGTAPAAGVIQVAGGGLNTSMPQFVNRYSAEFVGQTMLYRAEAVAYYVANSPITREPTLYRARFAAAPGSGTALAAGQPEALVEGVENIQLLYGLDSGGAVDNLNGFITDYRVAPATEQDLRRIGVVKVGLLVRSPERAGTPAAGGAGGPPALRALGTTYTVPPADGRYRAVYENTVALRNRLFGN